MLATHGHRFNKSRRRGISRLGEAHANDCSHEAMERALDETEHLCRRPRLLQAEYLRVWI